MAVEARHPSFFFQTAIDANVNPYNGGYSFPPLSGTTTTESFVPMYNYHSVAVAGVADSFPAKAAVTGDSSLTYASHFPISRKRPSEAINPMITCHTQNVNRSDWFTFLGEDVSFQIQQQQFEMDRLVAQHNDELIREIEERRERNSRRVIAAVEEGVMKKLKAKDDEIEKMGKLNWALQEKVKSLSIEGQIWRDLAHTNEAAAHALRANLDQVLAAQLNTNEERHQLEEDDDAQSCCGSNYREEVGTRGGDRKCRHCGEGESSVLLLPCRHLCLCTICGSSVYTCPVCSTPKNASVQVIMNS